MKNAGWYITQMKHRVGSNTWDSRVDPWDVFNLAGADLADARPWSLLHTTVKVQAVAGQDFIPMPHDFAEIVSATVEGIGVGGVQLVSPDTIRKLAQRGRTYVGWWFLAVDGSLPQTSAGVPALVRASIYPTPSEAASPTISLTYRRRWVDLVESVDDDRVPNLPRQFHRALTLACRVWAWEYLKPEQEAPDRAAYMAEIERLWTSGELTQTDFGPMVGGVTAAREDDDTLQLGEFRL